MELQGSGEKQGKSRAFELAEKVCNAIYENPLQKDIPQMLGISTDSGKRLIAELAEKDLIERYRVGADRLLRVSPAPQIDREDLLRFLREKYVYPYGWMLRMFKEGAAIEAPAHVGRCLAMKLSGYTNKEIAERYGLTVETVATYLSYVKNPAAYEAAHSGESSAAALMRKAQREAEQIIKTAKKQGVFISRERQATRCTLFNVLDGLNGSSGIRFAVLPSPRLVFFGLSERLVAYTDADKLASVLSGIYSQELERRGELPKRIRKHSRTSFVRILGRQIMLSFWKDREAGEKVKSAMHEVLRKSECKPFEEDVRSVD